MFIDFFFNAAIFWCVKLGGELILMLSSYSTTSPSSSNTNDSLTISKGESMVRGWRGTCFYFIIISLLIAMLFIHSIMISIINSGNDAFRFLKTARFHETAVPNLFKLGCANNVFGRCISMLLSFTRLEFQQSSGEFYHITVYVSTKILPRQLPLLLSSSYTF